MELVGNIIQSIAESFEITEIQTTAQFPHEIAQLNDITEKVLLKEHITSCSVYTSDPCFDKIGILLEKKKKK